MLMHQPSDDPQAVAARALRCVNAARERFGYPRLDRLNKGRRETGCACPIANSWPMCYTVTSDLLTTPLDDAALTRVMPDHRLGYYVYETPREVAEFIACFDAGLLPEYEAACVGLAEDQSSI